MRKAIQRIVFQQDLARLQLRSRTAWSKASIMGHELAQSNPIHPATGLDLSLRTEISNILNCNHEEAVRSLLVGIIRHALPHPTCAEESDRKIYYGTLAALTNRLLAFSSKHFNPENDQELKWYQQAGSFSPSIYELPKVDNIYYQCFDSALAERWPAETQSFTAYQNSKIEVRKILKERLGIDIYEEKDTQGNVCTGVINIAGKTLRYRLDDRFSKSENTTDEGFWAFRFSKKQIEDTVHALVKALGIEIKKYTPDDWFRTSEYKQDLTGALRHFGGRFLNPTEYHILYGSSLIPSLLPDLSDEVWSNWGAKANEEQKDHGFIVDLKTKHEGRKEKFKISEILERAKMGSELADAFEYITTSVKPYSLNPAGMLLLHLTNYLIKGQQGEEALLKSINEILDHDTISEFKYYNEEYPLTLILARKLLERHSQDKTFGFSDIQGLSKFIRENLPIALSS